MVLQYSGHMLDATSILITMCFKTSKMNNVLVTSRIWADEHSTSTMWGACYGGASSCLTRQSHDAL